MVSANGVSVIVCCHNSTMRLPETLKYLALLIVKDDIDWEVVLIDNNSTDGTSEVAKELWEKYNGPVPMNIFFEKEAGLSHARIKGINEANFEYLIFCDDDNWLKSDFVIKAFEIINSNPEIGALGGYGVVASDVEIPVWFNNYQGNFAVGAQSLDSEDVTKRGYLWGAGLVTRRSLIKKLLDSGFFFYCSGRKGGSLLAGDDSELCKWIILAGYKLWYSELLGFYHYMPEGRLKKDHLIKMLEGFKLSNYYLFRYNRLISLTNQNLTVLKSMLLAGKYFMGLIVFNLFRNSAKVENYKIQLQVLLPNYSYFRFDEVTYEIKGAYGNYLATQEDN
jgi:glycosyltransferase involved in cell wall biosynthesis